MKSTIAIAALALSISPMLRADDLNSEDNWIEDAKQFIAQEDEDAETKPMFLFYEQTSDDELPIELVQFSRRTWVCFARSNRGQTFSGQSRDKRTARRIAMGNCSRRARSCSSRGCR